MSNFDIKKIRKDLGLTQVDFAKKLGVDTKTVQNWEAGKPISASKHGLIRELTLKPQKYAGGGEFVAPPNLLPLLPIAAQGGSLSDFSISIKDSDCEKIVSPIAGADFAITVSGESMSPEYPPGSQVLIKRIDEKAFIDWGRVYVLDTCNGIVIKKLFPSDNEGAVICKSINPDYPAFEVHLKDVFGVFRVLMCMSLK